MIREGLNVTLHCELLENEYANLMYTRITPGGSEETLQYSRIDSRYSLTSVHFGHLELKICSVVLADAGQYFCQKNGSTTRYGAQLVVLG